MAELVYRYDRRDSLRALISFCLVTGIKSQYSEWQDPGKEDFQMIAQWDTGASRTVISKSVVETLGLKPTGVKQDIVGVSGSYKSDTYIVNLYFSEDIFFENLLVAEMTDDLEVSVLVGLDVILQSDFVIEPEGDNILLKFRHPSEKDKLFTAEPVNLFCKEDSDLEGRIK